MGVENHTARVIRIEQIDKAPNSDKLGLIQIGGFQVVVRFEDWKVGDLAIYIQPDSVVPEIKPFEFLWDEHLKAHPDAALDPIPEKWRRVTVRKFRGSYSEGLLMPLTDFPNLIWEAPSDGLGLADESWVGVDVAPQLGITHWTPPDPEELETRDKRRLPRTWRGWLYLIVDKLTFGHFNGGLGGSNMKPPKGQYPVYDVEALKNFNHALGLGEHVVITEKIHGSNGRYVFQPGRFGGLMYAGSRELWKGFRGTNIWRKAQQQHPWIEDWCRKHPGYALYGEVVPTQKGYRYGCKDGEVKFFVFDIRTPDGTWFDKVEAISQIGTDNFVPVLYVGGYDPEKIPVDGPSMVEGADHIREGCVITSSEDRVVRGLGRPQLKVVSNKFYEKDKA